MLAPTPAWPENQACRRGTLQHHRKTGVTSRPWKSRLTCFPVRPRAFPVVGSCRRRRADQPFDGDTGRFVPTAPWRALLPATHVLPRFQFKHTQAGGLAEAPSPERGGTFVDLPG